MELAVHMMALTCMELLVDIRDMRTMRYMVLMVDILGLDDGFDDFGEEMY